MTVPAGGASVPASTGAREDSAAQAMTKASGVQRNSPIPEAISERLARRYFFRRPLVIDRFF
ncbi:hypothetical protein WME89_22200 [Sorangium sp. So ce321]|uniref:hypothetical protein n=1 Tax=Sorangium sp. So ce321 TaxID=3133300 RepID=UPI003F6066C9